MPPRPRPLLLLLLDWDNTLTHSSTLPLILSISTHPRPHPLLPSLTTAYLDHLASHERSCSERTTLAEELIHLDSLLGVERGSVQRVEGKGVFARVRGGDVDRAAGEGVRRGTVVLRRGWGRLVAGVQWRKGRVGVVSVGWSRRFISSALGAGAGAGDGDGGGEVRVEDVDVRANEILFDGSGRLDRVFGDRVFGDRGIWTAGDKGRVMDEMVGSFSGTEGDGEGVDMEPCTVYVGDSPTDLGCLVRADVGICIRDGEGSLSGEQSALRNVLERVGVRCAHVGGFMEHKRQGRERDESEREVDKQLWWARDFDEVCESGILDGV